MLLVPNETNMPYAVAASAWNAEPAAARHRPPAGLPQDCDDKVVRRHPRVQGRAPRQRARARPVGLTRWANAATASARPEPQQALWHRVPTRGEAVSSPARCSPAACSRRGSGASPLASTGPSRWTSRWRLAGGRGNAARQARVVSQPAARAQALQPRGPELARPQRAGGRGARPPRRRRLDALDAAGARAGTGPTPGAEAARRAHVEPDLGRRGGLGAVPARAGACPACGCGS